MYDNSKDFKLDEDIHKNELKQEVRSDLYNTLEGVTGCKNTARAILSNHFEKLYAELGDSKELYEAIYKIANFKTVDGIIVQG